jgi:hypothetical protein
VGKVSKAKKRKVNRVGEGEKIKFQKKIEIKEKKTRKGAGKK